VPFSCASFLLKHPSFSSRGARFHASNFDVDPRVNHAVIENPKTTALSVRDFGGTLGAESEDYVVELGKVVITRGALATLKEADVLVALDRHSSGDWGTLCHEDKESNEIAVREGHRLLSVYHSNDTKFCVITEWDRSATTVLLPEEY
jgi:hypothetical protein